LIAAAGLFVVVSGKKRLALAPPRNYMKERWPSTEP
jgi:hypothetical protein